jgi:hypothetical protein
MILLLFLLACKEGYVRLCRDFNFIRVTKQLHAGSCTTG